VDEVGEKARRFISGAFGKEVRAGNKQSKAALFVSFRFILAATI
jgi:hypothetical protein